MLQTTQYFSDMPKLYFKSLITSHDQTVAPELRFPEKFYEDQFNCDTSFKCCLTCKEPALQPRGAAKENQVKGLVLMAF